MTAVQKLEPRHLRLREGSNHRYVPVHGDLARSRAGAGPGLVRHRPPLEYRAVIRHCNYGHEHRLDTFIEALCLLAFEGTIQSRADLDSSSAFAAYTHGEVETDGRDLLPLGVTSLLPSSGTRFKRCRGWSRRNGFCGSKAEHLHPVIVQVDHVYPPGPVHRYPKGVLELAIADAIRATHFAQESAVGVEHLHPVSCEPHWVMKSSWTVS